MQLDLPTVNRIPLPDPRTSYQLRRVKDKVIGAATSWDVIQKEYWPVFEIMEDLGKSADRNSAFAKWLMGVMPDLAMRNETWRRVDLAFLDPDRPARPGEWPAGDYFEDADDSPIILASAVVEREIEWLWPGRIPLGKQTTLAGPGGVGKSFLLCDVTARHSAGLQWPFSGGETAKVGNVLYVSGEDDKEDTLVPRLRLQGADLDRVAFLTAKELLGFNLSGARFREVADRAVAKMIKLNGSGFSLVVIDPPSSFLAGIDENSNAEVRGFLTPIKEWAEQHSTAVIFNTHVNKGSGKKLEVQQRVIGSVAMVNGPRCSHMVTTSEEDPNVKLFVPLKCNVWQRLPALSFKIVPDLHEVKHARLEWVGEVDIDAGDAVNGRDEGERPRDKLQERIEGWLIRHFKERPVWPTGEIADQFRRDFNMEVGATFDRATKELDIRSRKTGKTWERYVTFDWVYSQF